jgi:hypothetical protein
VTGDERNALLLAARLLESGLAPEQPLPGGGHVGVGIALAARLRRVAGDGERCRQVIASLRSAAAAADHPLTTA